MATKKWAQDRDARFLALGRAYVGFAQTYPGLFVLMFRSERLDWSSPALYQAAQAAFALLDETEADLSFPNKAFDFAMLVKATTRWSVMHGLATLLVDGRLAPTAARVPGTNVDELIAAVLQSALGTI